MILCYRQLLLSDHVVVSDGSSMQVGLLDDAQKSSSAGAATRKPLVGPPVNGSTLAIETIPKLLERGASPENITPVPVVVWPLWEFGPGNAEARHVEQDGIDESPYLRMTNVSDYDPNVVWVGDAGYVSI